MTDAVRYAVLSATGGVMASGVTERRFLADLVGPGQTLVEIEPGAELPRRNRASTPPILAYNLRRKAAYPPLEDLADALYWQAKGNPALLAAYVARVAAVKADHPKDT